jgi:lipopolysaccharide transport system ATP-binding protein
MSNIAIKIESLSKQYRYGVVSHQYLFRDMQSWWAKVRGKEDPNAKISTSQLINPSTHQPPNSSTASSALDDRFWALRDVNLEITKGDIVGIIGRNGAGKSTLLKILSRVTAPTKGSVKINGRIGSLLEVGTGFHPELTGRENVFLNGAILGMRKKEIKNKFDEIVAFAEIEKFIDTPVKRYSSGMYVRLAFAVAAHLDPEILVVDEVLAVGDAQFQKKCLGKMGDVSKNEGRTILFVSHNMASISRLCTRGVFLDNGRITETGAVEKIIALYFNQDGDRDKQHVFEGITMTVHVKNENGDSFDVWHPGDKLKIEVVVTAEKAIKEPAIDAAFYTPDRKRLFSIQSNLVTHDFEKKELSQFSLIYTFVNPGLLVEDLTVDIGLRSMVVPHYLAHVERCVTIPVSQKGLEKYSAAQALLQPEVCVETSEKK